MQNPAKFHRIKLNFKDLRDTDTFYKVLRGIVAEPHKWCGTDFLDLASLDPLWNTPSWDIKNGILEKFSCTVGGWHS